MGYEIVVRCSWCNKTVKHELEEGGPHIPEDWDNSENGVVLCPECAEVSYRMEEEAFLEEAPMRGRMLGE